MRSMTFFSTLASILLSTNVLAASPFMMPQTIPSEGMWYEGWFVRVTDPVNHRSFATITTSAAAENAPLTATSVMPGYAALVYTETPANPNHPAKTKSVEFFPERTFAVSHTAEQNHPRFTWTAEGIGQVTDRDIQLRFPSGEDVEIKFGMRKPWSASSSTWSPGGLSTYLPFVPLAWWVESLGTPVEYRLKLKNGEVASGTGYAHIEKNWGKIFPRSWMWVQATNRDNSGHLALAGGLVGFGPLEIKAYMIGYKTKTIDLEIRPDQGLFVSYDTEIDSCEGRFKITAKNLRDKIEIVATADPATFASVSIPTRNGYQKARGKESFSAQIEVSVFRDGEFVERQLFSAGALEFGADYMICPPPPQ